jgi:hypothetical protein
VTICPCCGFKFEGQLSRGCEACGARAVGEPLPKPEHELPSYARSLLLVATATLMVLVFLVQTIIAVAQHAPLSFGFWSWLAAAETASWRLKWVALPVSIIVLWASRKLYRSMLQSPARFCGLRWARTGLMASALVPLMMAILIGVTVPERLRQRHGGIEAGSYAEGYTFARAQFEYQIKYRTFPTDPKNDLKRLPDPDGSIAAFLKNHDFADYKTKGADVAALPTRKQRTLSGAVIRNASVNSEADDTLTEGLSFTNYELRLPGPDKLLGTDDDLIVRDGVITKASETVRRTVSPTASSKTIRP